MLIMDCGAYADRDRRRTHDNSKSRWTEQGVDIFVSSDRKADAIGGRSGCGYLCL